MTIDELVAKARRIDAREAACDRLTGHLFEAQAQQLSDDPIYVCQFCAARRTQEEYLAEVAPKTY